MECYNYRHYFNEKIKKAYVVIHFQAAFSPPTGVLRLDSLDSLSVDGKETYVFDDGYPDENDDGWDTDLEIDGTVE